MPAPLDAVPIRPPGEIPADVRPVPRRADEARATAVADGVWWLCLPLPYSASHWVNAFAIEQSDGVCLVDCGSPIEPGWDALEHALALAGVRVETISLLVCTHAHTDHYGLASTVIERTGCRLAMAPGPTWGVDAMREPVLPFARRRTLAIAAGIPEAEIDQSTRAPGDDGYYPRPEPDVLLHDGDTIPARGGHWRVVPAPGHSPTQIVLYEEPRRLLISADLVFAGRIPYVEYGYTPDPWLEHVESLRRARALSPALLLPGHGEPEADADARLAAVTTAIERAPERLCASLAAGPRTAWEATVDVLGAGAGFYPLHASLSGALCMLERLERLGRVDSTLDVEGRRTYRLAAEANRTVV